MIKSRSDGLSPAQTVNTPREIATAATIKTQAVQPAFRASNAMRLSKMPLISGIEKASTQRTHNISDMGSSTCGAIAVMTPCKCVAR